MKRRHLFLLACLVSAPGPAAANAGLPMIAITFPWMVVCLLPVIALEAWVYRRRLGLTFGRAAISSAIANLVSTLVGVPITWWVLFQLEMTSGAADYVRDPNSPLSTFLAATWQAPWLGIVEGDPAWMVFVAMAALFIPYFLVTWWIEKKVLWSCHRWDVNALLKNRADAGGGELQHLARTLVSRATRDANALSYLAMYLAFVLVLLVGVLLASR